MLVGQLVGKVEKLCRVICLSCRSKAQDQHVTNSSVRLKIILLRFNMKLEQNVTQFTSKLSLFTGGRYLETDFMAFLRQL
jgi:hypothetical protein